MMMASDSDWLTFSRYVLTVQLSQLHCQDARREDQTKGADSLSKPSFTQPSLSKVIVGVVGVGKVA
jgi:hypothetical protein